MTTEPNKPKRRRRWLQFSLRTFFVLLTVFCVWLGWTVHQARNQKEAVEWVREMGGSVDYDFERVDEHSFFAAEPPGPQWLRDLLGVDFFQEVTVVRLAYTKASDLTPLAKLTSLQALYLDRAQVSDLTPLAKLTSLETLWLNETQASEEQVEELRQALPNCDIQWSPPDPSP